MRWMWLNIAVSITPLLTLLRCPYHKKNQPCNMCQFNVDWKPATFTFGKKRNVIEIVDYDDITWN